MTGSVTTSNKEKQKAPNEIILQLLDIFHKDTNYSTSIHPNERGESPALASQSTKHKAGSSSDIYPRNEERKWEKGATVALVSLQGLCCMQWRQTHGPFAAELGSNGIETLPVGWERCCLVHA